MNDDFDFSPEQKVKIQLKKQDCKGTLNFLKSTQDRQLGNNGKCNLHSTFHLQARAEDELVKKEFKEMRCEMPGLTRSTFLMVFSPDGTKVASTHGNHNIYVTDVRTGKHIKTLMGHPRTPWCIAFHPVSNQIIASGCLGGQVRIWDLTGGSEVWTTESQTVIASIAFHPDNRLLVIATCNQLHFWDWSKAEPFMHVETGSTKEKLRYVAFDKLGHKLITGITNSPQTRWERVRAPVPVSRPADRSANPYRRRITPRLITTLPPATPVVTTPPIPTTTNIQSTSRPSTSREPWYSLPERSIGTCYRDLLREYEVLVHRYLQIYRPPVMIDQGTDPMDINTPRSSANTDQVPSTSSQSTPSTSEQHRSGPGTSRDGLRKKSSASQPAKNRKKTIFTDSSSSSSSNTSPTRPETIRTNEVNSAAVDDIEASLSSSSPQKLPGTSTAKSDKVDVQIKIEGNNSSSDDDEDKGGDSKRKVPTVQQGDMGKEFDVYKYLNLARRCDTNEARKPNPSREIEVSRWMLVPTTTESTLPEHTQAESRTRKAITKATQSNQTQNTSNSTVTPQPEPVYKMMIKCSVTPSEGSSTAAEATASTSNPEPSTSTAQNSDKISVLIRNAELMLAKFRENLEQREHLTGLDLPSTSRSLLNNQKKKKPSKGTNTNESDTRENIRKRSFKLYPVLDSSTEMSSSDDEQKSKRVCSEKKAKNVKTEHTYAANAPSTSNDHNYADNLNEHSYAGLTEGNSSDNTVRIKINLSSVRNEDSEGNSEENNQERSTDTPPRPINFNAELELLVTDLLANGENNSTTTSTTPTTTTTTTTTTASTETTNETDRFCNTCGGSLEERNQRDNNTDFPTIRCIRTNFCNRNSSPNTRTTNTSTPSSDSPRRRFFSHRLSAFYPTRLNNLRLRPTLRSHFQPLFSSRLGIITEGPRRSPSFAPDEVINYAERVNEEEAPRAFHPFDPPPEMINPEIFGIGNMYSNIVQELESSLNDLWNIRANRRLGETSDMLSSFSERLESIMTQSNAILRNLSNSLDSLSQSENGEGSSDSNRFNRRPNSNLYTQNSDDPLFDLINSPLENRRNVFTNNPITSDHTYPLNPENPSQSSNISPLMFSLKLTVSHIQRQARLLRQQVESIERIDRAMLEVAQLQMMRQMFDRLRRHFSSTTGSDSRIGVSSVRQMMAGTRISDSSSPYDSPNEEAIPQNPPNEPRPSTSENQDIAPSQRPSATSRARTRKTYPRCLFLMNNRQQRRTNPLSLGSRRTVAKERVTRRNMFRRFLASRSSNRPTIDMSNRGNLFNADTLSAMIRRLEHFLMEHGRYIGSPMDQPHNNLNTLTDLGEHIMMLRLNNCRERMNSILGIDDWTSRHELSSVTVDGSSRLGARQTLSHTLDTLSRYLEIHNNQQCTPSIRSQLWEIIELSLLLSEILLLQIVDSIPQTSGMNLEPERESLASRIDQMRMLTARESRSPSRVSAAGHSLQLTRSLRFLRMTISHANQALGQTYTSRRNAMLPTNNDNESLNSRQELLDNINNCLRNIRRHRETSSGENIANPARGEWEMVIRNTLLNILSPSQDRPRNPGGNLSPTTSSNINISTSTDIRTQLLRDLRRPRYRAISNSENIHNPVRREWERVLVPWLYNPPTTQENSRLRNSSAANPMICPNPSVLVEDANSSDDNTTNSGSTRERIARPLYRTSNVNLLHNEESNPSGTRSRMWNVPTVLVNDVPINEAQFSPWHPRFRPMFLHPLHAGVNPLNADWDDPHREQIYDSDIITTVTPNQRIQVWEFSDGNIPSISDAMENVVVNECKIHNDASVDYASDGSILVTLLPSGGYMNVTNRLGVYSLDWKTLGQCLYVTSFEQNAVSVSLSPLNRHLVVGLASRRVSIMPSDKWTMARIFLLDYVPLTANDKCAKLSPIRELEQNRDTSYMSVNCIRWLPTSGQGLAFATNTGHLRFLT